MTVTVAEAPVGTDGLVWQMVIWPLPLRESAALGLVRHFAAQAHAPQLIVETRADVTGVTYLLGCPQQHASAVQATVERLVRGSMVVPYAAGARAAVITARRVVLSSAVRSLEPIDPVASTRSVLHALTTVGRGEQLVIQQILGPRITPRTAPKPSPVQGQSVASRLWVGVAQDRSAESRQALLKKIGQHGFAAAVRIGVQAPTAERRRTLLLGLTSALSTANAPGVKVLLKSDAAGHLNTPKPLRPWWNHASRLTAMETVRLSGWPVADRDDESFPGQPPKHPKPIRPTAAVLAGEQVLASANAPGANGTLGYNTLDRMRHTWVLGPPGTGKSTLLLNLIGQDLEANRPVVVIEPKDLVAELLPRIPAHRAEDVVLLDPLDAAPVGINPLHRGPGDHRSPEVVADSLFATFKALYRTGSGDGLGPRSSDILRHGLQVLTGRPDASLVMLPLLLNNPGFRHSATRGVMQSDPFDAGPFWQWFNELSPEAAAQIVAPLSNKVRPLLDRNLRAVLAQRQPRFNIRDVLTDKKILLVPLQKGVLGPEIAQLLAAMVLGELWQAICERTAIPEARRDPVMIYVDEVQEFLHLPTDLDDALATARSLKAGFHLAHQFEGQLPRTMVEAFRSNARNKICFQLSVTDAKAMAAGQSVLAPEDFTTQPAHHIYATVIRDNSIQPWASGITLPPPPEISDPADIRQRSRTRYGQSRSGIDAGFAALLEPTDSGHGNGDGGMSDSAGDTGARRGQRARRP
ncbi:Type IV secretory pathway, VirD4 components [Mycobacteroides abscessus subsp. abscessus]|uniref:type IV secretory system conjugative DNA transfer family protein n=1 Tax=Mycobacteroides abscessus TaxID=36809 RepID=UPI00092CDA05|nr:type IV secretory system conjugative DNA transfer family protein [Mycobacteroides abscessus]SIF23115.1 Type IV secretory pathway, VirD4 components [Mycobacteroides abscessus subsp. abscessus]